MVVFSSVSNPISAPLDETFWRVATHNPFNGQPEDLFGSTSMHLSFTRWERAMDSIESQGVQDIQSVKMESVISIRDSGRWIGDVDVISAIRSPHIYTLPPQEPCHHTDGDQSNLQPMTSIENWDQLRDFHSGLAVVRVHGNWLARLAVTAYLSQRQMINEYSYDGGRITLLPSSVCWKCLKHEFSSNLYIY
jgi:hypothetical protein